VPEAYFDRATSLFRSERFCLLRETFVTSDGEVVRPVIHHPGAVGIVAVTPRHEIILVRQYRYPIRKWTLEIPAGTRVIGEPAVVTAARELREEAGYVATRLDEIVRFFPAVGVSDEEMILFRAHGLSEVPAAPEHGELVERVVVPLTALSEQVASGAINDAKTLIALSLLGCALRPPRAAQTVDKGGA
jgi:ADP-ribose pyrophosphatase